MRKLAMHFIFWVVFFLMWNRVMYFYMNNALNRLYFSALDVSLIMLGFYILYYYIMPAYFRHKKVWLLLLRSALLIAALSGLSAWFMMVLLHRSVMPISFDFSWTYTDMQYNRFFIALIGVLGGGFVKLAADRIAAGKRITQMEKERSEAELVYLKAQVNPHFLFNSLNSLYAQMELEPAGARHTLSAIADMLRYQLYDCNTHVIPLDKELAYLGNYFNLQSIRKDNCITELLTGEIPAGLTVAPLLLIPFLENAFKYVSDYDTKPNFIKTNIRFIGHQFNFHCSNSFDPALQPGHKHTGIGLINVKKRLALIYGDQHQLHIIQNEETYTVNLTINLNNAELPDN